MFAASPHRFCHQLSKQMGRPLDPLGIGEIGDIAVIHLHRNAGHRQAAVGIGIEHDDGIVELAA